MPELGKRSRRADILALIVALIVVPIVVVLGAMFSKRSFLLLSILIIVLAMVPFFASFERRRPEARELVILAVMVALAVASRAVFAFVPQFKPMAGLVMIAGIAFGASPGFLVGALAAFVSNFIFGQGPWTPFQMLAFGLCGCVFGALADHGIIPRSRWDLKARLAVSLGGGLFILVIAGPILDTSSLFWMASSITPETVMAIYGAGVPMNALHGAATFATLFLVGNGILDMLVRVKRKHGMSPGSPH